MVAPNFANRTLYHGDNLEFLRGMNSEAVHLIATDPPFNKGRDFHATPDSLASGAKFQDRWSWADDVEGEWIDQIQDDWPAVWEVIDAARAAWGDDMAAFLCFMGVRLIEMRRVLRADGSLYLHCDPTASHYLKALLDGLFGRRCFTNEISWRRSVPKNDYVQGAVNWPRNRDVLLHYRASAERGTFNQPFTPISPDNAKKQYRKIDPETGRRYQLTSLTAPGAGTRGHPRYEFLGVVRHWRYNKARMHELLAAGRIIQTAPGRVPRYKRYLDESSDLSWDRRGKESAGLPKNQLPSTSGSSTHPRIPATSCSTRLRVARRHL